MLPRATGNAWDLSDRSGNGRGPGIQDPGALTGHLFFSLLFCIFLNIFIVIKLLYNGGLVSAL